MMVADRPQSMRAGDLGALRDLVTQLQLRGSFHGDVVRHGRDPVIRSPHRLGEASANAQLLIGVAAASITEQQHALEHLTTLHALCNTTKSDALIDELPVVKHAGTHAE